MQQEYMLSDEVKSKFEVPDTEPANDFSFSEKSEMQEFLNKKTLSLLEKAITHVRKYDSKETGLKLVLIAYRKCPSHYVKKHIIEAHKALKAAIKAEQWLTSKRKKKYVSESTVTKNVDHFYEYVSEAVAAIRIELDKSNLTLFNKIKKQYQSEIPLVLAVDKKFIIKRAHVVVMCNSVPVTDKAVKGLERNFYLIENVSVIGINRNLFKNSVKKAKELILRKGKVIYEQALARPSNNIDWYLVLDFGVNVTFASFADNIDTDEIGYGDATSYESYLRKVLDEKRTARKLKTERLRAMRQTFIEENKTLYEDIRIAQIKLENLEVEKQLISEEFTSITAVGNFPGLDVSQIKRLYQRSIDYRSQINFEGTPLELLNVFAVRFRIEAKATYYNYQDVLEKQRELRQHIKYLEMEISNRKQRYVQKAGMTSITKYVASDLD